MKTDNYNFENLDSFDEKIKNSLKTNAAPSDKLNWEVKIKMKNAKQTQNHIPIKIIGKTAAAAAISLTVLTAGVFAAVNISENAANSLYNIPVIGNVAQVMTIREYKSNIGENFNADIKQPKIESNLSNAANKVNKLAKEYTDEIIKMYESDMAESNGEGNYNLTSDYCVVTDNDNYFTLKISTVVAMGGSNSFEKYYTIDKKADKLISLSDLFDSSFDYKTYIYNNILEQMKKNMANDESLTYFIPSGDFDDAFAFTNITGNENFYVGDNGNVVICFDKYDVAPGYMGLVNFEVPMP